MPRDVFCRLETWSLAYHQAERGFIKAAFGLRALLDVGIIVVELGDLNYCGNRRDLARRKLFRLQWTNTEAKKARSRTS